MDPLRGSFLTLHAYVLCVCSLKPRSLNVELFMSRTKCINYDIFQLLDLFGSTEFGSAELSSTFDSTGEIN